MKVELNLTEKEYQKLMEKAGRAGLSVSGLLENFIRDLTYSNRSNGSDEREMANAWFDRCCFGENTFLRYVIDEYGVEEFVKDYNRIRDERELIEEGFYSFEERSAVEEDIEWWESELRDCYDGWGGDEPYKEAVEKVIKWWNDNRGE